MFKKIEAWILYLTLLIGFILSLMFSFIIYKIENPFFEKIRDPIIFIFEIPERFYREFILRKEVSYGRIPELDEEIIDINNISDELSFDFISSFTENDTSYLQIISSNNSERKTLSKIKIPSEEELIFVSPDRSFLYTRGENKFDDIYFKLKKYDVTEDNIKLSWTAEAITHHQINVTEDGFILAATSQIDPKGQPTNILGTVRAKYGSSIFRDDGILEVSPDGEIIYERFMTDILEKNNLKHLYLTHGLESDPFHLNSVYKSPKDYKNTPIKKGDLLISLRHSSMVMIIRPSTDKVIWYKSGPWLNQHDASFDDDGNIVLFNNNVISSSQVPHRTAEYDFFLDNKGNSIHQYNFSNNETNILYGLCFNNKISTVTGGDFTLNNDTLFVNYHNFGLTMMCDTKSGKKTYFADTEKGRINKNTILHISMDWAHYKN